MKKNCKYQRWFLNKENNKKSCLENPYKACYECAECKAYSEYVAMKVAGELD